MSLCGIVYNVHMCRIGRVDIGVHKNMVVTRCIPPSTRHRCTYETNFMRNNVIVDTLEKLTNTPYIFEDDTEEESLLMRNKEIATIYALIILICILYIVLSDFFDDKN